jgi:hypothetical protein
MQLRRLRFTVRSLMVVVALVAFACWVGQRHARFRALAADHESRMIRLAIISMMRIGIAFDRAGRRVEPWESDWHEAMAQKYRRAARFPWLPIAPDPPIEQYRRDYVSKFGNLEGPWN